MTTLSGPSSATPFTQRAAHAFAASAITTALLTFVQSPGTRALWGAIAAALTPVLLQILHAGADWAVAWLNASTRKAEEAFNHPQATLNTMPPPRPPT